MSEPTATPCPGDKIRERLDRLRVRIKEGVALAIEQGCELSEAEIERLALDCLFVQWGAAKKHREIAG